jgi:hypothetical protein
MFFSIANNSEKEHLVHAVEALSIPDELAYFNKNI